jgi:hypothetical protein
MNCNTLSRALFVIAGIYDWLLGALFLMAPSWPFRQFDIAEPNHPAYVQFPGALLMIFALMFFLVASDPSRYRQLIPFGILLKVAYCGLAFGYWSTAGIPGMWKVFAVIDLVMGVLFVWSFLALRPRTSITT